MATHYLRLMYERTKLHTSAAVHKKWSLVFCRLRERFGTDTVATVVQLIETRMPRVNYTLPQNFFEQFGPLLTRCQEQFPEAFVVLPVLPAGGQWQVWAGGFQWPHQTPYDDVVTALRLQLHYFRERANGAPIGWPVAAAWFDNRSEEWHGWAGCPPMIKTLWRQPHEKYDPIIRKILSPSLHKMFLYGSPSR